MRIQNPTAAGRVLLLSITLLALLTALRDAEPGTLGLAVQTA